MKPNLAFCASHNGSSAKAIVEACQNGVIAATPVLLISNNANSNAMQWAKDLDLNTLHYTGDDDAMLLQLRDHKIDWIICSGFMKLIGPKTIAAYRQKIVNVHPALLPAYGGKGMYGHHVHEAVKAAGDTKTGVTIHYVDEIYDNGAVIAQKEVPVCETDTAQDIENNVKAAEPGFYVETLKRLLD